MTATKTIILEDSFKNDNAFNSYAGLVHRTSQLRIQVDICNFTDREVNVFDSHKARHEILPEKNLSAGRTLVLRLSYRFKKTSVKINAEEDYSERFIPPIINSLKDFCRYRLLEESNDYNSFVEYSLLMVFEDRRLNEIGNRIDIPEIGGMILVGNTKRANRSEVLSSTEETLIPKLRPENGLPDSGIVVSGVDKNYLCERLFYRVGKEVFEISLNRSNQKTDGLYFGCWNKINLVNQPGDQEVKFIKLEDALTGKNELGIKVFRSITEARESVEELEAKPKDKGNKEKEKWDERDQRVKHTGQWVKVLTDFVKNLLPATVMIGKTLFGLWSKSKGGG